MRILNVMMIVIALAALPALAQAAVKVVASSTDLAAIAREIGGGRVQVESLARGDQDLHRVEPRPSFVARLAKADMVVRLGMDLDVWMDALLQSARNAGIRKGGKGYVDASAGIAALEVPTGKVDGSKGDIHIYGNPHYWLDPENGKVIARNILAGLKRVDPGGARVYQQNYDRFARRVDERLEAWQQQMAPLRGAKVVTYHTTWSYFNERFGLVLADTVEPKPGIPPSAAHISGLVNTMKRERVSLVLTARYYPTRFTDLLKREANARVVILPTSVEGAKGVTDYFALFDITIAQLLASK
jgi:zinc/manganese transport system substrate-binding protein